MCVFAPVVEGLLFRSLLIFAVRPTLGDYGAIIASGLLFAAIHVIGGNPSPENQIAGFVFAWAYLRSGTILVPLSWHAAGNVLAFGAQVANWHFMPAVWP
jgi:membrane protease YdiL (CAAX protease family)